MSMQDRSDTDGPESSGRTFRRGCGASASANGVMCGDSGGSGGPYAAEDKNCRSAPGCCRKPGNITPFLGTGDAEVPGIGPDRGEGAENRTAGTSPGVSAVRSIWGLTA